HRPLGYRIALDSRFPPPRRTRRILTPLRENRTKEFQAIPFLGSNIEVPDILAPDPPTPPGFTERTDPVAVRHDAPRRIRNLQDEIHGLHEICVVEPDDAWNAEGEIF